MSGRHTCFFSLKGSTKKAGIVTKATRLLEISTSYRLRCLLFPSEGALSFIQHVRKQARKGSSSELLGGGRGQGGMSHASQGGPLQSPHSTLPPTRMSPVTGSPPKCWLTTRECQSGKAPTSRGTGAHWHFCPISFLFFFLRHC